MWTSTDRRLWPILLPVLLAVIGLAPLGASANTFTWDGGDRNWYDRFQIGDDPPLYQSYWNTVGNPPLFPGAGDHVWIDGNPDIDSTVVLDNDADIGTLTIDLGDRLIVDSGNDLDVHGASIANAGILRLQTTASILTSLVVRDNASLTGGGELRLRNTFGTPQILGGGSNRLTNVDNDINGLGRLGFNTLAVTNQDAIYADAAGSDGTNIDHLSIDPVDSPADGLAGAINTGVIGARPGSALQLEQGVYDNTGGVIEALDGGRVRLHDDADIVGGTLQTFGSGVVESMESGVDYPTVDGVTNAGLLKVPNGLELGLRNIVNNTGAILVETTGSTLSDLHIEESVTLTGGGEVRLRNTFGTPRILGTGTNRLTNEDNDINGLGNLGVNALAIANRGAIYADTAGSDGNNIDCLIIDPAASPADSLAGVINTGFIGARENSKLQLNAGSYDNAGGVIEALNGGRVRLDADADIRGGTLQTTGTGAIESMESGADYPTLGDLTNTGLVKVPNGLDLGLAGTIANDGTILVETTSSTVTELIVDGPVTLEGSGAVQLRNSMGFSQIGGSGSNRLVNMTNTIDGIGDLGTDNLAFTNHALVEALGLAGGNNAGLEIDPADSPADGLPGVVNRGTLRATGGGVLILDDGLFDNDGGVIEALDGSEVRLETYTTVRGGTLRTEGTGAIRSAESGADRPTVEDVTNTGLLKVPSALQLALAGAIANTGTILVETTSSTNTDLIVDGAVTLEGGGSVRLRNPKGFSRIVGTGSNRLVNADNTIDGIGDLCNNNLALTNLGTIEALGMAGLNNSRLAIDPANSPADGGPGVVNRGTMRATGGGALILNGGLFDNDGGVIEALDGSQVRLLSYGHIRGGTLRTEGDGAIVSRESGADRPTIEDLANEGLVKIAGGAELELRGTIENTGTLHIRTDSGVTSVARCVGPVVLEGGGTVEMINIYGSAELRGAGNYRLTNYNTIVGEGRLGDNALAITNYGTVSSADQVSHNTPGLTIDPANTPDDGGRGFVNHGSLIGVGADGLTVTGGSFVNHGLVEVRENSRVAFTDTAVIDNLTDSTLTGGAWRVKAGGELAMAGVDAIDTNDATIELIGAGSAFAPIDALADNRGTFRIAEGRNFTSAADLTSSGAIDVGAGSTLTIEGDFSATAGSVTLVDGALAVNGGSLGIEGIVGGTGSIADDADLLGACTLAPGRSVGELTFEGSLAFGDGAAYAFEVGSGAEADKAVVLGSLEFAASAILNVSHAGDSLPEPGDKTLFEVTGVIDTLPAWTIALPQGWSSDGVVTQGNAVVLSNLNPIILGDFNADGVCNELDIPDFKAALADPDAWQALMGRDPHIVGDFDGNGACNGLDIVGFKLAADLVVPEPASVLLLVAGLGAAIRRRHR